ncbi:MAG: 30S ribosomal protein S6 [Rickettsiales bacterium]|nr:30S ribosomal protein S6 [Rickettsiales bacterium]
MAFYESIMVFRGDLAELQVKDKAAKYMEIIKELKGRVASSEFWGLKNLAYVIRKNKRAHFVMLNVEIDGGSIAEYERRLRIDEDVVRYLNVRVEKLAAAPSIMMKKSEEEEQ